MTVYVCFDKDIECGEIPANWCVTCPKRKAAALVKPMTDHTHTCSPGCTECDRAERISVSLAWNGQPMESNEILALHAQREALTQEVKRLREQLASPVRQHLRELPWDHWKPEDKP